MEQPEKIEFNIDGQYENEKGVYKVISMHGDKMLIRWESGEEIRTDIELQRRILERREWERLNKLAEGAAKGSKSGGRKKAAFTGFAPTDFKKSASGTTWRSRSQLGEAVTRQIDTNRFQFKSWAFSHKPEMHVQDIKHHGHAAGPEYQARFFVRVDQKSLHYGFRVARSDNEEEASTDWKAFYSWLTQQENDQMLHSIAAEDNLTVCNRTSASTGTLLASDEGWRANGKEEQPVKETLEAYINDTPGTGAFDLELSATIDKTEVVESGLDIAESIAQLFTRLLPLYRGAVIR